MKNDNRIKEQLNKGSLRTHQRIAIKEKPAGREQQIEEQIKQQYKFAAHVLKAMPHVFYIIDTGDYTVKMASSAASFGDLSQKPTCYALTHNRNDPCRGEKHRCTIKEVQRTKKPVILEHIHFDKCGNSTIVEVHGYPITDEAGNIPEILEYTVDVTERKRKEEALEENEARYHSIFDQIPCPILELKYNLKSTRLLINEMEMFPDG